MNSTAKSRASSTPSYKHSLTMPTERSIEVERTFDAPRDRVWRAVTEPELLAKWWGRGNRLTVETYEFEKGGHWRFVEHSDHGDFGFEGRFREITPQSRISLTFEFDGMPGYPVIQTMELRDAPSGKTKLVSKSVFFTREERDGMVSAGMEGGMAESYAALDRLLPTL